MVKKSKKTRNALLTEQKMIIFPIFLWLRKKTELCSGYDYVSNFHLA